MKDLQIFIPPGVSGRLDTVMVELLAAVDDFDCRLSRSQIKKRVTEGLVSINGVSATKAGVIVDEGDEVFIEAVQSGAYSLEPYDLEVPLVFEDEYLAVIDKPPHLTVHPGAGTGSETLLSALIAQGVISPSAFPGSPRPGIVHRLDKETSGLLVVAKTAAALSHLSQQFQERKTFKRYVALALSKPRGGLPFDSEDEGKIEKPIGRDSRTPTRMAVLEGGKTARTDWKVRERFLHGTLLELVIHTGRTHQIRVHLEAVGSGVLGDKVYGDFTSLSREAISVIEALGRQALHAERLEFDHPKLGERCVFEAPIPADLMKCLESFRQGVK